MLNHRQTVEIAAMIAAHSAHVIEGTTRLPDAPLQRFWKSAKRKMNGWRSELSGHVIAGPDAPIAEHQSRWQTIKPILEDIFVSEILTRVWGAVLTAYDQRHGIQHAEPFARSTLIGHLQCRQLALSHIVDPINVSTTALAQVDRFRRRTERWTDMCLGHLLLNYAVRDFAFEARRAIDFGDNPMMHAENPGSRAAWMLIMASLRMAFSESEAPCRQSNDIDRDIRNSIIACFPPNAFHRDGPF